MGGMQANMPPNMPPAMPTMPFQAMAGGMNPPLPGMMPGKLYFYIMLVHYLWFEIVNIVCKIFETLIFIVSIIVIYFSSRHAYDANGNNDSTNSSSSTADDTS